MNGPIRMKPHNLLYFFLFSILFTGCKTSNHNVESDSTFVKVKDNHFEVNGKPYHFIGANFWYGMNLGARRAIKNRERLLRELDRLKALGINNIRIMGGSEGPDTEPYRIVPALQIKPGLYNREVLEGLDFLLDEMRKREMYAVVCLNNYWSWSGGMAQYLVWAGAADSIPYPPPHRGGDWSKFQDFISQFYTNQKAIEMFNEHIEFIVNRKNSISALHYKDDPTIMSWELANEPRVGKNIDAYLKWIQNSAARIKTLDQNHLVTIGSEGNTASGVSFAKDHANKNIDYTTIHIWVQNWGVYNPKNAASYDSAVSYTLRYLNEHERISRTLNKPMVVEKFGISRDLNDFDPKGSVTVRDQYYAAIFEELYNLANTDSSALAGSNFWAWGGEGRPKTPGSLWVLEDDFIGDPPHEPQGWYSIYDTDSSTQVIIHDYAVKMAVIDKKN